MEVISLGFAFSAVIAACGAAFWAGRVDARVNNGLSTNIENIREDVGRIFSRLDDLPCDTHGVRLMAVEKQIERE